MKQKWPISTGKVFFYVLLAIVDIILLFFITTFIYESWQVSHWLTQRDYAIEKLNRENLYFKTTALEKELENSGNLVAVQFSGLDVLAVITQKAEMYALQNIKIEQMPTSQIENSQAQLFSFKLSCNGDFVSLWQFFRDLEIGFIPIKFEDLEISGEASLLAKMQISAISLGINKTATPILRNRSRDSDL